MWVSVGQLATKLQAFKVGGCSHCPGFNAGPPQLRPRGRTFFKPPTLTTCNFTASWLTKSNSTSSSIFNCYTLYHEKFGWKSPKVNLSYLLVSYAYAYFCILEICVPLSFSDKINAKIIYSIEKTKPNSIVSITITSLLF